MRSFMFGNMVGLFCEKSEVAEIKKENRIR